MGMDQCMGIVYVYFLHVYKGDEFTCVNVSCFPIVLNFLRSRFCLCYLWLPPITVLLK